MGGVLIQLCGSLKVCCDGTGESVGSAKERRLLALLAVYRSRTVELYEIVEALWSEHPPQRSAENVATLVSRLRAGLGKDVITGGRGGYRLGRRPAVVVDLDEVHRFLAEADLRLREGVPVLAVRAGTRALDLLGAGSALIGEPDVEWVRAARREAQGLLRTCRHCVALAALRIGEVETAGRVATAAIDDDPFDEHAHRLLITSYQGAGEPSKAVAAYQKLRRELAEELGVEPADETRQLYQAILRGDRLREQTGTGAVSVAPRTFVVGRDAELGRIGAAWTAAVAGDPRVVLLIGEAGIGKTRLAVEAMAVAEATGAAVLATRCYAAERSLFLQPFVEALTPSLMAVAPDQLTWLAGPHAHALARLMPEVAEALALPEATVRPDPQVELRQAYEAVIGVLRRMASIRPVLLVLDDLHNTGAASVALVHYLARQLAGSPVMVAATVRAEEGAAALDLLSEVAERIEVGPLDARAVGQLASHAGRADLAEEILARTGGHPLFVVETLRALDAGRQGVPDSLKAAVLSRVERAGTEVAEVLRAGSVLAGGLDPTVVAGLLDLAVAQVLRRCESAVRARLLTVVGNTFEFSNDLLQEIVYATTPLPSRMAYHRRAAALLVDTPEAAGMHAEAAGDWRQAAEALLRAGGVAAGRGAAADAVALLSRALDAAERTGAEQLCGRVRLARARALEALEAHGEAVADLGEALSLARRAGDPGLEMTALRELGGDAPFAAGVPVAECAANLHSGLRIAHALGDRSAQADLLTRLAVFACHDLRFTEALDLGRRAAAAGRAAGDERARMLGVDGLKTALVYLGDLDGIEGMLDELEALTRSQGDLFRLQWILFERVFPAVAAADWRRARSSIDEAIEVNRRSGYGDYRTWFVAHLGWVARMQGRYEEALALGRRAVDASAQQGHRWWRPTAQALLATSLRKAGRTAEAADLLTEALAELGPDGAPAPRLRCLAELAAATGSRTLLDEADAALSAISVPPGSAWLVGSDAYLAVARCWLTLGSPERAGTIVAGLLRAAERQRWIPVLADAELVQGLIATALGDARAGVTSLTRARDLARRHGMANIEHEAQAMLAAAR